MNRYLSFGGGVNSTALLLLLTDEGVNFEAVFVNHGTDYPETYAYVEMLRERGYRITELKPTKHLDGHDTLYDYCMDVRFAPTRLFRWCTDHAKMRPMWDYIETPCKMYIGIDAGEERRAIDSRRHDVTNLFPLIEYGIDRVGCMEVIEQHDLPLPPKSGCFICPFQKRRDWIELSERHPDLWCKALSLEATAIQRQLDEGKHAVAAMTQRPLEEIIRAKDGRGHYTDEAQDALWDDRRPCQCGL